MANYKQYLYTKGTAADSDFSAAPAFGKIRVGSSHLFWKSVCRWYSIPLPDLQRSYRRVEQGFGRLCCGGRNFVIEWLVLVLCDGRELVLHIGDDVKKDPEALMEHLQRAHPQIQYGKVYTECSENS